MEFIFIITGVIVLILAKLLFNTWFSPFGVYGLVWIGTLLLYYIPIVYYYPLSAQALVLICLSFFSFALGAFTIGLVSNNKRFKNTPSKFRNREIMQKNFNRVFRLVIFLFSFASFLGLFYVLLDLGKVFGFQGLFTYYGSLYRRRAFTSLSIGLYYGGILSYCLAFIYSSACLSGIYMAMNHKTFSALYLTFLNIILYEIIYVGRAEIITFFILFLSGYYLTIRYNKISKKDKFYRIVLSFGLILLMIFIFISSLLAKGTGKELLAYTSISLPSFLYNIYTYPTSSIGAFNAFLERENGKLLLGQATFYPIAVILHKLKLISHLEETSYVLDNVYVPIPTNTFTYLRPLYEDFNVLGLIIIPYFIGLLSSYIFVSLKGNFSLVKVIVLSYIYAFIVFSIQGNLFWNFYYVISIISTCLITKIVEIYAYKQGGI